MPKFAFAALCAFVFMSTAASAMPVGTWLSQDGGTKIRIADCGGKLCATVVWLDEPIDRATGKPKTDKRNPDPGKRARPLLGLQVVQGMAPSGPNRWSGQVYNADDGRTYSAHLSMETDGKAKLKGCVLAVLCKNHTWTRVN